MPRNRKTAPCSADDQFHEYDNPYAAPLSSFEDASYQDVQGDIYGQDELRPFQTIWFHPRKTVRSIVAFNPEMHVLLLVCLAGIGEALDRRRTRTWAIRCPWEPSSPSLSSSAP